MTPATNIGIFYDLTSGQINSIMNPDFEEEIDMHVLGTNEGMYKIPKLIVGVMFIPNSMSVAQVSNIISAVA